MVLGEVTSVDVPESSAQAAPSAAMAPTAKTAIHRR
jgi:hypothetical protein